MEHINKSKIEIKLMKRELLNNKKCSLPFNLMIMYYSNIILKFITLGLVVTLIFNFNMTLLVISFVILISALISAWHQQKIFWNKAIVNLDLDLFCFCLKNEKIINLFGKNDNYFTLFAYYALLIGDMKRAVFF